MIYIYIYHIILYYIIYIYHIILYYIYHIILYYIYYIYIILYYIYTIEYSTYTILARLEESMKTLSAFFAKDSCKFFLALVPTLPHNDAWQQSQPEMMEVPAMMEIPGLSR